MNDLVKVSQSGILFGSLAAFDLRRDRSRDFTSSFACPDSWGVSLESDRSLHRFGDHSRDRLFHHQMDWSKANTGIAVGRIDLAAADRCIRSLFWPLLDGAFLGTASLRLQRDEGRANAVGTGGFVLQFFGCNVVTTERLANDVLPQISIAGA